MVEREREVVLRKLGGRSARAGEGAECAQGVKEAVLADCSRPSHAQVGLVRSSVVLTTGIRGKSSL